MTSNDTEKPESEVKEVAPSESQKPTELEEKIIKQIEFYFGDANLPRDKFMLEQIKLDNGWIPMTTMLKFQRLAKLSTDVDVIINALKLSQLIEVDKTGSEAKLRRSPEIPLPELNDEKRKEIMSRTIYSKGFPKDAQLDDVMAVFAKFGPVDHIHMRRYKDTITQKYLFKGSVFVTFPSKEKAQAFLDEESVKVGETLLDRKWQADYLEGKKKEFKEKTGKKPKVEKENDEDAVKVKGSVIHLKGDFLTVTREDVKEALEKIELVPAYIGFNKGDKDAYLRFSEENSAIENAKKLGEEFTILDAKLSVTVLEGEEELKYWQNKAAQDHSRGNNKRQKRNGPWKSRGGGGGKRQRRN